MPDLETAQEALEAARAAVRETPEVQLLQAEVNALSARIEKLDAQIVDLQPAKQEAQAGVAQLEAELQAVQTRLAEAVAVRRRVLGRLDSLSLTRTQLVGARSVKQEELQLLRTRGPSPVVRWAGSN